MNEQGGFIGWILGVGGVIVSTLAGLVAMFYREQIAEHKAARLELTTKVDTLEKRADICEEDRNVLQVRCAVLENRAEATERFINELQATKASHRTVDRRIDELKQ